MENKVDRISSMPNQINSNWENWGDEKYAEVMYRRAIGDLPEMESSKALARRVVPFWRRGDSILDVGCGAGHYLRSLRREFGSEFDYTGVDITPRHLALAKRAFASDVRAHFDEADLFDLKYGDASFDIAICTNLMQNLPSIVKPLSELVRATRRAAIVRLLCGDRTFLIRDVHPHDPELDFSGEPHKFNYYNIYSHAYIGGIVSKISDVQSHSIEADRDYSVENIDTSLLKDSAGAQRTTTIGGYQTNGYILLPWAFLTILKSQTAL
jgi:ubiquinone/menaquinone biosynthesis C-methylase UbiE